MTDYKTQLREGGYKALLVKLNGYEKEETYEDCEKIYKAIQEHNRQSPIQYPTRLRKEEIYSLK